MKNYSSTVRETLPWKRYVFSLIVFLGSLITHVYAQSTANYAFTTNTSGSLGLDANGNVVDMSAGTTQLVAADLDDAVSSQTGIGFTFNLMGLPYNQFYATSNGVVQLGTSTPSTTLYVLSGGSATSPRIGALAADLRTGAAGKVHYKLVGTAPNRCLVIEFLNMSLTYVGSPGSNDGTYQVRLYETSGAIEFVYGSMYRNASTTSSAAIYSGFSVNTTANNLASITTSANTVSTGATFNLNSYTTSANIPNLHSTTEGSRRVYRFTPPAIPAAATALTFTGVGATVMTLNWVDNATTESGYNVYRSLDGVTYTLAAQLPANSTTYAATGLALSTNYFWKVTPWSEAGNGADLLGTQSTTGALMAGGTKTVGTGGDYQNLTTAFADINAQGLTGNVDLQLIAGYPAAPETYPIASCNAIATGAFGVKVYPMVSGLSITSANATGTLNLNNAANVTFDGRVNQTGAKDLVISNTNAGTSYAIQFVNDARNNTFKYCTIHSVNTGTSSGTIVFAGTNGTTGNDNNTIDNCDIKDGAATPINAIYSAGSSTTLDNSGNVVSNSNIYNYFNAGGASNGIFLSSNSSAWTVDANRFYQMATRTLTAAGQHRAINIVTSSGNGYVITNNVIGYASAAGTGVTTYTASAGRFFGIELTASNTGTPSSIQGNTVTAVSLTTTSGTTGAPGIFAGISVLGGTVSIGNVTPNVIGAGTGTGAISVTTSNSANIFGIHASSTGTLQVVNNVIGSITGAGNAAGITCGFTGINTAGAATATTVTGNTIGGATANSIALNTAGVTTGTATVNGIATTGAATTLTVSNNTISNLTNYATSTSAVNGIASAGSPVTAVIGNNTITNMTLALGTLTGVSTGTPTTGTISGNVFANSSVTAATGTAVINGISVAGGTTVSVLRNKLYDLSSASATATVNGIVASAGTTVNIYNNAVADLKAPVASAADVIRGIAVTSTSATSVYRVYYNTVYLNATSTGTNFGTSGVFHTANATATTAALDLRNNIIINQSVAAGTGMTVALRRSATALGNYASVSNRNMLFAGVPSATNLIMYDGTTSYQTMVSYQTAALPRDANSFTGEVFAYGTPGSFFISLTGSSSDFLKPVAGITTQAESGATNITTPAITDDFAGVIRAGNAGYAGTGTNPDLGAFEFEGVSPTPVVTLNSVTPPATTQCAETPRLVSVNVNPTAGTTTAVFIGYTVNGTPQTAIPMTNTSGSTWEGTIPSPTPANATVAWGVSATNSIGITGSLTGTPYTDAPLFGMTASATSSATAPICAGSPADLTAKLTKQGTATVGSGSSASSNNPGITPFYGGYGGVKTQYLIRASELTAAGLSAGNITSLSLTTTTVGATLTGFAINAEQTALNVLTGNIEAIGNQVYSNASFTPVLGLNTFTFSTPLAWDGTSNIILSFCWSNNNSSNTVTHVLVNTTSFVAGNARYVDSKTAAEVCGYTGSAGPAGWNGSSTSVSSRPIFSFAGTTVQPITAVSWSDGVTTVGTTNPSTVNPTVTTTYTATITALGCTFTPAPTATVAVNPLPASPTATNSAQCGVQVPTASVTSATGAPTPTFNWYAAATGGLPLQSNTSTTYTTAISSTTTFYVAEVDGTTSCESPRTAVTVTVSTPDPVSAIAAPTSFCLGNSVTLTGSNTNPTPLQSYTYSWSGTAGSGAETPVAGNPATITPTAAGTYVYTATAVDGGCTATTTVSVTVHPNPTALVISANDTEICNGTAINLTASATTGSPIGTVTVLAQDFNAGLGTWTTTYSGNAPVATAFVMQNAPYSYSTSFTNFATPNGGGFAMSNADLGASGQKTRTTLVSPAFSTVGMASATLTFQNLYQKWNSGDSLVRLEISTNGGSTWATLKDYLPLGNQGTVTTGSQVPANESITLGAPYLNQADLKIRYNYVTAWGYYWIVDNVTVSGAPTDPTTYAWTSVPAGFTSSAQNPTGVSPAVSTTYGVTITNSFGCSSTGNVAVTVNQPTTSSMSATACASYTLNGTTYNASGMYTQTLTNAAGCDSTLTLNLTILQPTTSTMSATACVSYTLNGTTYNTSGVYTQVLTGANAVGCDSTITLNLTITQPTTSTVTATACSSYTLNGTTYNASGTYTQMLTNAAGCDSTLTLNLTINQPTTSTVTAVACSSYTLNGSTYNTSGTYTQMLTNAAGCDSTLTLMLTINQPTTASVSVTGCNSATVNGTTYTTSGVYTQTLTNAAGCDSTLTVNVTLNNTFNTITDVACGSYIYNGTTYTTSGVYMDTLTNAAGCDSIVTLNLTINMPTSSSMTETACGSYTLNGTTYNASGTYMQTLMNAAGCDSTITLNLTVNQPTTASMTVSECESFTYNGSTYTASGVYTEVLTNAAGCDSVVTINLTIIGLPNAVATDNGDLTITASTGASYQWVHCATGLPIAGATSQTFTATVNGSYAVVVTNAGGCSDTSNCVLIDNIGIDELTDASIRVFPNPTNSDVTVTMTSADATIEVADAKGTLLQTINVKNGEKVDLSTYETGVYFLRIRTDNGSAIERVVKN
jgi:hypothetical protein